MMRFTSIKRRNAIDSSNYRKPDLTMSYQDSSYHLAEIGLSIGEVALQAHQICGATMAIDWGQRPEIVALSRERQRCRHQRSMLQVMP